MRETTNRRIRRATLLVVTLAVALVLCSCAGSMNWIQDRLPPPAEVDGGIIFRYHAPSARQVTLAGSFNSWGGTLGGRYDPSIDRMSDTDGDGTWIIVLPLPPGRYQYKYVIDGGLRWEQDPNNPDKAMESGFENSLIVVPPTVSYEYEVVTGTVIGEGFTRDTATSTTVVAGEGVSFEVDFPEAGSVSLAGTFNDWDPTVQPLVQGDDGLWRTSIELEPGEYLYKFVVDGTWVEDPGNPESVDDGYGGVNSILIVE